MLPSVIVTDTLILFLQVTACDGDFGGPLVCGEDDALYGIISRGDPEKYVIFTRVDRVI